MIQLSTSTTREKIALIGIGCRFPGGANDYQSFWQNLLAGKDCLEDTPKNRFDAKNLYSKDKAKAGRLSSARGGYIDGFDEFDPSFFGIGPREAECMDPQQRKLLEVAWEALEDAGQKPLSLAGQPVGVFMGGFTLDYKIVQFADLSFKSIAAHTATGTMMTLLSNRLSYCFDLRGPSMSVDTACSSSLVTVHLACESLLRGESNLALAGGVLLHMTPQYTVAESKGGFLSPEGLSRTFDEKANGYVRAEGVGIVVLKRLSDALKDGDHIHSVIIGSGVNQDGRTNGITVPNPDSQIKLIRQVCSKAGIVPGDLDYIEAHGTSTPVGDPIEANALGKVLKEGRKENRACYIGSVKTNIGHTEAAAGVAGLIKTALSLKHKIIPPHINLETISPALNFSSQPYDIPREPTPWPQHDDVARAGVNSFGFGGTNAHVLLEEAPKNAPKQKLLRHTPSILPLSARDDSYFLEMARRLKDRIANNPEDLEDIVYTLSKKRQNLDSNLAFVYKSPENLVSILNAFLDGENNPNIIKHTKLDPDECKLVWVFTGMGPQWWGMGCQLFEQEEVYRKVIEECDKEIKSIAGWSLIEELNRDEKDSKMAETWLAQPANFAMQIALAALWRSYGISPHAIVGHSTGEAAAFYEAGVYTFQDAIKIIIHRSRLQQQLVGSGTMLAVGMTEEEALVRIAPYHDRISIAAINSPSAITLSGDEEALKELCANLEKEQIFAKFLTVLVPYHSAKMDPIRKELLSSLKEISARKSTIPLYLTGRAGRAEGPELGAAYWWDNVRGCVRFKAAIEEIAKDGYRVFLEIGPHPVLAHAIQECMSKNSQPPLLLASCRRQEDENLRFKRSLAALHTMGFALRWENLSDGMQTHLPPYPWKRDRFWMEAKEVAQIRLAEQTHPLLGRRLSTSEASWELVLDLEHHSFLGDHRIEGNVVFPAAAFIEMAFQAMGALSDTHSACLADIELHKALFVPDSETKNLQFSFNRKNASFTIASNAQAHEEPIVHASGIFRVEQRQARGPMLDLKGLQSSLMTSFEQKECYKNLARMGYHYGAQFSPINNVWLSKNEALASIVPMSDDDTDYHCHPTLLDACFQTLLTTEILSMAEVKSGIRLPLSIKEIHLDVIGTKALWARAIITHRNDDEISGDIFLYDENGHACGSIKGFRAGNIEKASAKVNLATMDNWLCEVQWMEKALSPQSTHQEESLWVLFEGDKDLSLHIAEQLSQQHHQVFVVRAGNDFVLDLEKKEARLRPNNSDDLDALFSTLSAYKLPKNILYMWPLAAPLLAHSTIEDISSQKYYAAYSLISLAQTLEKLTDAVQLFVITRGAHGISTQEKAEALPASIWGSARVLWHQELIEKAGKIIDLDPMMQDHACLASLLINEVHSLDEEEVAWRENRRYTSRLQEVKNLSRPLPLSLRTNAAYLVTGAFGSLGKLLCKTLVKRGARRLILMSRSLFPARTQWKNIQDEASKANIDFVRDLEALGAQVYFACVDVSDEKALENWYKNYQEQSFAPIRGVFHLAGQVRDALIKDMSPAHFNAAYDPKVKGAFNLHHLFSKQELDHFVLFSSIASLLCTAGQSNYAAGNAFLDALAHYRRASGMAGLSIDWGPWATGMIEELGLIEHYRQSRGMSSLSPDAGMDVFERVVGQNHAQLLVATIVDWPLFLSWYPKLPRLVSDIASRHREKVGGESKNSFIDTFRMCSSEEKMGVVEDHFRHIIAEVLRINHSQIEMNNSLNELGLDSLLAIELRARIQREMKTPLTVVNLLSTASIKELSLTIQNHLMAELENLDQDASSSIEVFTNEREYPLTHNQKALWFLKHLDPHGFAYNIGGAVEIHATLKPEIMFEAVRILIHRHPSLRANFIQKNGQAVSIISDDIKEDIRLFNVEKNEWSEIYQMIIQEYRKPYDLAHDPLMRFRLFRLSDERWIMMKAVHHIISDAISTFTFIEELLAVYESLCHGKNPELPMAKAKYLDFLNWQNKLLASPAASRMLAYWQNHLPKEIPHLNLATDRPRPVVMSHNGASHFFILNEELSKKVHHLAKEQGMTVFMVLLSAYYAFLSRYSGQEHIIVGSPVLGRTEEEFASVYGYFVNPLPLYADLSKNPTTLSLMEQVQKTVLNGLDNQEYPFTLLVDKLGLKHDPSRSRVFQAMFILLAHRVATTKYGYRLKYIELPEEEGQFDLTMSAYEDEAEGRFHCVFKYNSDLFLPSTIERMAEHYMALLNSMIEAPTKSIYEIDMLLAPEKTLILDEWSGQKNIAAPTSDVVSLFNNHATKNPEKHALALPCEDGEVHYLSYGELAHQSDHLARHLQWRGIGKNCVVAICLPKSFSLIVATLGVLKSGAAYLPLDPDYPKDRIAYMLNDSMAKLVIVDKNTAPVFGFWEKESLIIGEQTLESLPTVAMQLSTPSLEDAAYYIYTSGSTGRPKGVVISHQNLASAYAAWEEDYRLAELRVHAQLASFSFDVFAGDFVRALCSGASLLLIDRNLLFNTARLYHILMQEKVDCVEFVPAVLRGLMRYCQNLQKDLRPIKLIAVGSDAWSCEEMQQLKSLCDPSHRVINSYGLSEATIDTTYFEGSLDNFSLSEMVPIGKPFKNSLVYLLDRNLQAVPAGVVGELWIGGLGLSRGYTNASQLNEERFKILSINDQNLRLYKTGDLAMWDRAGILHLLGRADNQVKVRGYRIEIGEIETQLKAHADIADAVVAIRKNSVEEAELCAYCIPHATRTIDISKLKQALSDVLPAHMIPTWIQSIDAIPLSPNGKVDLKSLPSPIIATSPIEAAPQTFYERKMAEQWMRLLGLSEVGLDHDFFDLGGTSIKLIELVYHLQEEFNITIAVSSLFKNTTLYGMAKTLEHIIIGKEAGSKPYLVFNAGKSSMLFCFPPAGGHGLVYRRLAEQMPDHSLVGFNYIMDDNKISLYADLVESIQKEGPIAFLGYSLGGNLAFLVGKELERRGRCLKKLIIMDSYRISEEFEFGEQHLREFESELSEHLMKHTGSSIVASETLSQAQNYIKFCSRTLNNGTLSCEISIISDENKLGLYEEGQKGAWHGSSLKSSTVYKGFGSHAAMLDVDFVAQNALLTLEILGA